MGIVASLFSGIKRKAIERQTATWPDYRSILLALANGDPVDTDEAGLIFDELGKTEADVSADVETMRRRLEAVARLQAGESADKRATAALARRDQLLAELAEHYGRLQPQIDAANADYKAATLIVDHASTADRDLAVTVLDPGIIEDERRIQARLAELLPVRAGIVADLAVGESGTTGSALVEIARRVRDAEKQAGILANRSTASHAVDDLENQRAIQRTLQARADGLRQRLATIDAETADLHRQLSDLHDRKQDV